MPKDALRLQLQVRLKDVAKQIRKAEQLHADGTPEEKVHAAGELTVLKQREAEISAKIDQLETEPDSTWESLKTEIDEDLTAISAALRRSFAGL